MLGGECIMDSIFVDTIVLGIQALDDSAMLVAMIKTVCSEKGNLLRPFFYHKPIDSN